MAITKTFTHLDGYVVRVEEYVLSIEPKLHNDLINRINEHKDIKPEMFGFLLGQATPVFKKVVCEQCKKNIKTNEEYKSGFGDNMYSIVPLHKKCAVKREKKHGLPR